MRALTPWRPAQVLTTLRDEFDDLFSRFFGTEGGEIDPESVTATYRNGVLEISMIAPAGSEPTRVPVTTA